MALIKKNANINDISGSIGSNIFSSNKGNLYIRSKPKRASNPQSARQSKQRDRVSKISKCWNDTLTQGERNAWESYAGAQRERMSGFDAFLKNNLNASNYGVSSLVIAYVGNPVIARDYILWGVGYTHEDTNNPAPASGNITELEIWNTVATQTVKFKTFRNHIVRESTELFTMVPGYNLFTGFTPFPIAAGDNIGFYTLLGRVYSSSNQGTRFYWASGDRAPGQSVLLGPVTPYIFSIRAKILAGSPLPPVICLAPLGITPPDAPVGLTAQWNPVTKVITVTWTPGNVPGSRIGIWLNSQDSPVHRQLVTNEDITVLTKSISQVKAVKGVTLNLSQLKGTFDIQAQACDNYGQLSPPTELITGVKVI